MRVLLFSLTLMLLSGPCLAVPQSSSSSRKDIPPATAKSGSPQAVDVATIQALTHLQDKADSVDERLNDLKENMRALIDANNRSVDIVKDLAIAIIGILGAILVVVARLLLKFHDIEGLLHDTGQLPRYGTKDFNEIIGNVRRRSSEEEKRESNEPKK